MAYEKKTRSGSTRNALANFTEHAMAQIEEVIPSIGYVPPSKRPNKKHILVMSDKPLVDVDVNITRIGHADPIGFLAALMQGQPVQVHTITPSKHGEFGAPPDVKVEWVNADLPLRAHLAKYFADKLVPYMTRTRLADMKKGKKTTEDEDETEALFARAANEDK